MADELPGLGESFELDVQSPTLLAHGLVYVDPDDIRSRAIEWGIRSDGTLKLLFKSPYGVTVSAMVVRRAAWEDLSHKITKAFGLA